MRLTVSDLLHPDSPQVAAALTVKCGICHVKPQEFCHAMKPGKKMACLVHFDRAAKALGVGQ